MPKIKKKIIPYDKDQGIKRRENSKNKSGAISPGVLQGMSNYLGGEGEGALIIVMAWNVLRGEYLVF